MTLSELRGAFTFSDSIVTQTRKFRLERLATIMAAEGPWDYRDKPVSVFHIVPFVGIAETINIDFSSTENFRRLSPLPAEPNGFIGQGDLRYNLDGAVMREGIEWHTQIFRNGSIEYATTKFFDQSNPQHLDAWNYQINLLKIVGRFFALQRALGVAPPVTLLLSIMNAGNFHLRISEGFFGTNMSEHQIDRDQIFLPEVVLNDFSVDRIAYLKPVFDCLWNAAGEKKCGFYRFNGEWNIDPSWLDPPNAF